MNNNLNNTSYSFTLRSSDIKRFVAYVIDCAISVFIVAVVVAFLRELEIEDTTNPVFLFSRCFVVVLLFKDLIGIGKRLMHIQVISCKTGWKAKWYQRLFRNVTLVLMPVEIIMILLGRPRLGDQLCQTDVVLR
ncbi:MAG: RDD family protein [Clostridia bacterium]|nr:RDD family protein [Clostridia bacterium]